MFLRTQSNPLKLPPPPTCICYIKVFELCFKELILLLSFTVQDRKSVWMQKKVHQLQQCKIDLPMYVCIVYFQ